MKKPTDLVFIVFIHFRTWMRYTRRPHFAELNKQGELYVIENPLTIFSGEFLKNIFKSIYFYFKYSSGIRKDERSGASVLRPVLLFSLKLRNKYKLIKMIDNFLLKFQLKKIPINGKTQIRILTNKNQEWLVNKEQNSYYVLDMNDEWSMMGYEDEPKQKAIENAVKNFIKKVDMVTAVTIHLANKYNIDNKAAFIPNAVDTNHYVPKFAKDTTRAKEELVKNLFDLSFVEKEKNDPRLHRTNVEVMKLMETLKHPLIGSYSGLSGNWSDFEFMAKVEKILPSNFTMVSSGNIHPPTRPEFMDGYKMYMQNPRMIYLQYVDYAALPDFLDYLDVGIVMHRMDAFNKHSAPNKIWAYLAMGLPVVSTNFLNDYDKEIYEGLVKFASTPEEYVEAIIEMHMQNSLEEKIKRRELAVRYSAENRAGELARTIINKFNLDNQIKIKDAGKIEV